MELKPYGARVICLLVTLGNNMRSLSLSLIFAVILGILSLGWLLTYVYQYFYDEGNAPDQHVAVLALGKQLAKTIDLSQPGIEREDILGESESLSYSILDKAFFPVPEQLKESFTRGEPLILESSDELTLNYFLPSKNAVLMITMPNTFAKGNTSWTNIGFTLAFYVGVVILVLAWLYPLINRLTYLRHIAQRFGEGDLDARVKPVGWSYIFDIENEFNFMAKRIQNLLSDNKLLSRAVSHDLKTPLARLRFGIDTLSETENEIQQQKYILRIQSDLFEMERLVETLLEYARLDDSSINLAKEEIIANEWVKQLCESRFAREYNLELQLSHDNSRIVGDKRYLTMALKNLIVNAVKHGSNRVLIKVSSSDHKTVIEVEDDGKGFSREAMRSAFLPFWKGDQSRESNIQKGHGMGLAIVEKIASWHHADVQLGRAETLKGAKVSIVFPKTHLPV